MIKTEAKFQTKFNKWLKYNHAHSAAYELKQTPSTSLPFSDVKTHQLRALNIAHSSTSGLPYKISDQSLSFKPFDCFKLYKVPAYIVIMFRSRERNQKEFIIITINDFVNESKNSQRKSLTEERAKEIGHAYCLA